MKANEESQAIADEVISELHQHKLEIAEEHGFDLASLLRDLQTRQNDDPRVVDLGARSRTNGATATVAERAEGE